MDDDRKNSRGKPPRSGGAARPGKGGDGAKHFRKHTPARPYEKGGEGFPKRSQDGERPVKRAYAKRQDSAARDDSRSGAGERKPWRKDANDRGGPDAKPFAKRKFGERPPSAEGGERRFVRRNEVDGENRERKPFVKRAEGAPRRDAEGRPQYWGKRPGKAEREVLAKAAPEGGDVAPERREPKSHGRFDRPARRDQPDGDRPQRFGNRDRDAAGQDRPRKNFGERKSFAPREEAAAEDGERIAKRLARAGIASRRDAEELIASGRVKVNGKVLDSPGFQRRRERQDRARRHGNPGHRADAAFPVPQAGRRGDDQPRPGRAQDGVRRAARKPATADDGRAAGHQHRGTAAADQ
jgi:23S rRNA pseudouridine2605 synthase